MSDELTERIRAARAANLAKGGKPSRGTDADGRLKENKKPAKRGIPTVQ